MTTTAARVPVMIPLEVAIRPAELGPDPWEQPGWPSLVTIDDIRSFER